MERVLVLGRGGVGKSTFAQQLGSKSGLPVIELDSVYWDETLEPLDPAEWVARQSALAELPRWVMDGDLGPYDVLDTRLSKADAVVLLDLPLWLCAWRAVRRGRRNRDFWLWMARWRHHDRPRILEAVRQHAATVELVHLKSRSEIDRWLTPD